MGDEGIVNARMAGRGVGVSVWFECGRRYDESKVPGSASAWLEGGEWW